MRGNGIVTFHFPMHFNALRAKARQNKYLGQSVMLIIHKFDFPSFSFLPIKHKCGLKNDFL